MSEADSHATPVPTIDISGFLAGTDLVSASARIKAAATTSGFFQIVGHGIPTALFDDCYRVADVLFTLPQSGKDTLRSPSGHPYRGLMTNFDKSGRVCSEGYTVARFEDADDAHRHGVDEQFLDYFHPNVWPEVAGLREAMDALRTRTRELGTQMMRMFAIALDLSIDYFDKALVLDTTTSTIRSYPPSNSPLEKDPTIIFDEHFDGGMLTLLHQRGTYDGLQIRDPEGEWFTVPTDDDAFVVNIGELMSRWTNGRWPATRHRVIASTDPAGYRQTLPTFYTAAVDTEVAPLPTQLGEDGALFEPTTVYQWFRRHLITTYQERKHTTVSARNEEFVAGLAAADTR
jgi:isopenicillin N synthase-like dioxygenase